MITINVDVDIDISDYVGEISDRTLISELKERNIHVVNSINHSEPIWKLSKYGRHQLMCDILDTSRTSTREEIVTKLESIL